MSSKSDHCNEYCCCSESNLVDIISSKTNFDWKSLATYRTTSISDKFVFAYEEYICWTKLDTSDNPASDNALNYHEFKNLTRLLDLGLDRFQSFNESDMWSKKPIIQTCTTRTTGTSMIKT